MARLLIMARDSDGSGGGQYLKGDIVHAYEDGYKWQKGEMSDKFIRVDVPGEKPEKFDSYLLHSDDANDVMLKRRAVAMEEAFVDSVVATGSIAEKTLSDITAAKETRAIVVEP